jgi:Trk-type K+ transport system membrane component
VYFVLSLACVVAYRWAGMNWADAFMHMCTTMGLGGFSSHDASFGFWNSPRIEAVAIVFMVLSGISFVRYFMVIRSRSLRPIWSDREIRAYVVVLLGSVCLVAGHLLFAGVFPTWQEALRNSAFHVVSVATTTGYASTDYALWPAFVPVWLMFLGCFVSRADSSSSTCSSTNHTSMFDDAKSLSSAAMAARLLIIEVTTFSCSSVSLNMSSGEVHSVRTSAIGFSSTLASRELM